MPDLDTDQENELEQDGGGRRKSAREGSEERPVNIVPSPRPGLRVLISDRDSMGSDLIADALSRDNKCEAIAMQPSDVLTALSKNHVDLVVIGVATGSEGEWGFNLTEAVGKAYPNTYVVIILDQSSHESVINAFRSGARGVFCRQRPMSEFLECVEHVGKGMIWVGRQDTNVLLEAFKSIPAPNILSTSSVPALTARELQVVRCAAQGKTNKAIASELLLSEHTVKNYLFRSFEKLGVSSRVELLFYLTIRGHTFRSNRNDTEETVLGES
jgi:DNA-binding NarL/FixJ family response regulator